MPTKNKNKQESQEPFVSLYDSIKNPLESSKDFFHSFLKGGLVIHIGNEQDYLSFINFSFMCFSSRATSCSSNSSFGRSTGCYNPSHPYFYMIPEKFCPNYDGWEDPTDEWMLDIAESYEDVQKLVKEHQYTDLPLRLAEYTDVDFADAYAQKYAADTFRKLDTLMKEDLYHLLQCEKVCEDVRKYAQTLGIPLSEESVLAVAGIYASDACASAYQYNYHQSYLNNLEILIRKMYKTQVKETVSPFLPPKRHAWSDPSILDSDRVYVWRLTRELLAAKSDYPLICAQLTDTDILSVPVMQTALSYRRYSLYGTNFNLGKGEGMMKVDIKDAVRITLSGMEKALEEREAELEALETDELDMER